MVISKYSRFRFDFPCSVVQYLWSLFAIFEVPAYIHTDQGTAFTSGQLKPFLIGRNVAVSWTTHMISRVMVCVNVIMGLYGRPYDKRLQTTNTLLYIGKICWLKHCMLSGLYCVLAQMQHCMGDSLNSWDETLLEPLFCHGFHGQTLFC